MLYVQLPVHGVRRVLGVMLPIEFHRDEAFPLAGPFIISRADMEPFAIDIKLGETVKAVNPLDPSASGDTPNPWSFLREGPLCTPQLLNDLHSAVELIPNH